MSLFGKRRLLGSYLGISHTFVDLAAFLVKRKTKTGQQLFIEEITEGGIIHNSGIKHADRVISVNLNTDVDQMPFDSLVEAIYSLNPLVLELARDVNGKAIWIVIVLDVAVKEDKSPYLKFVGFYWNVRHNDVEDLIPVIFQPLVTYNFIGKVEKSHFFVKENSTKYYLTVEGDDIKFTTSRGTMTAFTVYKYSPTVRPSPSQLTTILVPGDQPNKCLAATAHDHLQLKDFPESKYTSTDIPTDSRFLEFAKQSNDKYYIESTKKTDSCITKRSMSAVMTASGSLFTWESADDRH